MDVGVSLGGASGKEPTCQSRRQKRPRFHPWIRKIPWRRAWQPTPVFLPRESRGQRSLAGYSHKELDTIDCAYTHTHTHTGLERREERKVRGSEDQEGNREGREGQ